MELFGVGWVELIVVVVIALIILGPSDIANLGRTLGRVMRKVVMSPEWRALLAIGSEVKEMPTKLMREAQFEDLNKEIQAELQAPLKDIDQAIKSTSTDLAQSAQQASSNLKQASLLNGAQPSKPPASPKSDDPYAAWKNPSAAAVSPEATNSIDPRVSTPTQPADQPKPALRPGPVLLTADFDEEETD